MFSHLPCNCLFSVKQKDSWRYMLYLSSSFVLVISVRCQLQWSLIYAWPKDSINNRVVQSSCLTSIRFYWDENINIDAYWFSVWFKQILNSLPSVLEIWNQNAWSKWGYFLMEFKTKQNLYITQFLNVICYINNAVSTEIWTEKISGHRNK